MLKKVVFLGMIPLLILLIPLLCLWSVVMNGYGYSAINLIALIVTSVLAAYFLYAYFKMRRLLLNLMLERDDC